MTTLNAAIKEAKEIKSRYRSIGQISVRRYLLSPRKFSYHPTKDAQVGDKGGFLTGDPYEVVAIV